MGRFDRFGFLGVLGYGGMVWGLGRKFFCYVEFYFLNFFLGSKCGIVF